ncbi:NADH ubiquinone oxidoreductase subunit NDUFA12-domain-containing protein [Pyronema domesticum]|uniref:NADH dehydrogenase [ubiquinone] 1 alpha subcomplex subunit n=1 Tax=Pyronema omphalodes (strain CBS 100304) TaxID=1076935 RepID=U4LMU4_PYROM|nr:NADH ubiquinone oxidoreductase subunit NDUFA12-domain-containing protein [Pyronema domesticum]CCX32897.1 Similar to NADH dehydrogenase [ubiquinone] 1 alpha subcomplex subunit 12; acc. no. Q0MQ86 [Pyronema omphalodes CBS 100304]
MSTPSRTLRNLFRIGPKKYFWQMLAIGDTKAGTLVGTDRYGNKFYENVKEELPLRTKWVDYKDWDYDAAHVEPGWHAWLHHLTDKPPGQDPHLMHERRAWEPSSHVANLTWTRGAYKPYSTVKPKIEQWEPVARTRA